MSATGSVSAGAVGGQYRQGQPADWFGFLTRAALSLLSILLIVFPVGAILIYAVSNYAEGPLLFADARFGRALLNTLVVTIAGTATAAVFALPMAWAMGKTRPSHRWIWDNLTLLPAMVPPLVGAMGWLIMFSPRAGLINGLLGSAGYGPVDFLSNPAGIGFVVGLYQVPFMFAAVRGALEQVSSSFEEASRVFGTRPSAAFIRIVLPMIKASVQSATLAVIMRSMANIGVPLILGQTGNVYVLSSLLFSYVFAEGALRSAAQLGLLFILVAAAIHYLQRILFGGEVVGTLQVRQARNSQGVVRPAERRVAYAILLSYAVLALILPFLGVLYLSLIPFWNPSIFEAVFSFRNYTTVLGNSVAQLSVQVTLTAAALGAILSIAIVTIACFNSTRRMARIDLLNMRVLSVPLGIPPLVFGLGVLFTVVRLPLPVYGTTAAVTWAFVAYWVAFAQQAIGPFFAQIPRAYDQAAALAGDSPREQLLNILVPLLGPSLVLVGGVLFLNMMTDLPLVVFLNAPGAPLMPAQLYAFWSQASPVRAAAFAIEMTMIALVIAGAVLFVRDRWIGRRRSRGAFSFSSDEGESRAGAMTQAYRAAGRPGP